MTARWVFATTFAVAAILGLVPLGYSHPLRDDQDAFIYVAYAIICGLVFSGMAVFAGARRYPKAARRRNRS